MIQAKGSFINEGFKKIELEYGKEKLEELKNVLSEESKKEIGGMVLSSGWYSCDAFEEYLQKRTDLLFHGDMELSYKNSIQVAYDQFSQGIYKVLVKFGTPSYVIKNVVKKFERFYKGIKAEVVKQDSKSFEVKHIGMQVNYLNIQNGFLGYSVGILMASGAKNPKSEIVVSCAEGKGYCQLRYTWE